jgi:hypothetical protein
VRKPGAYPGEEPFRCSSLVEAPGITHIYQIMLDILCWIYYAAPRDKNSRFLLTFINYVHKKFNKIGH